MVFRGCQNCGWSSEESPLRVCLRQDRDNKDNCSPASELKKFSCWQSKEEIELKKIENKSW